MSEIVRQKTADIAAVHLTATDLYDLCPILIYQLNQEVCDSGNPCNSPGDEHDHGDLDSSPSHFHGDDHSSHSHDDDDYDDDHGPRNRTAQSGQSHGFLAVSGEGQST